MGTIAATRQPDELSPWQRSERAREQSAKRARQAARNRRWLLKTNPRAAFVKQNFAQPQQGRTKAAKTLSPEEAARIWAERGITPGRHQE